MHTDKLLSYQANFEEEPHTVGSMGRNWKGIRLLKCRL